MNNIQILQDQREGLVSRGQTLRDDEALLLKAQGLSEQIMKENQNNIEVENKLETAKNSRDALKQKKADAVASTTDLIVEKMNKVLPVGEAIIDYADGDDEDSQVKKGLYIGWCIDKKHKPYNGLSGGEKQIFDTALAHVLEANIIVLEAAELDSEHLSAALEDLAGVDAQVFVNTCHSVDAVPPAFTKIEVGGVA